VNAYREALADGARAVGIDLESQLADQLTVHHELVVRWAKRINLTTITDPKTAAEKHGLDSLLIAARFEPDDSATVVDVGSGAGFPGLVVALARPKLQVRLLEPIRKRASFLRVALAELGRPDVSVVEGKLLATAEAPWQVDALISRATIPPLTFVGLAAPYLAIGGRLILTSGSGAPTVAELADAAVDLEPVERVYHELPGGDRRVLDELRRVSGVSSQSATSSG